MSNDDAVVQLLIAGQTRIEQGLTLLAEKLDGTNSKLEETRLEIAGLGIKPRLEGLEGFRKQWEPKFIIGLFLCTVIGAGLALLVKKIFS